jgi:hypothetical protein
MLTLFFLVARLWKAKKLVALFLVLLSIATFIYYAEGPHQSVSALCVLHLFYFIVVKLSQLHYNLAFTVVQGST